MWSPDMRILLLQVGTRDIKDYAVHSLPHNLRYAAEKGYDYFLYQNNHFQYPAMWLKIEVFKHVSYAEYDHIWVLDADCVINDFSVDLEKLINKDRKDIIISENGPNGGLRLNSGSTIYSARIVPYLLERYDQWVAESNPHLHQNWHDQQLINEWNDSNPEVFSVREFSELNSWWCEMNPSHFVFHFMARPTSEKADLIRKHVGA
jgi:galactosyl transferase GMA12/MNN10 family